MVGATLPAAVATALAEPEPGRRISVAAAGITWSALVWGDPVAPPLLLVHGVTSSAAVWWRVGPALAAAERRVIGVDQAGHGQTGRWLGHHRFRENAADLVAFVRAAGLDRGDLQVVGHSWGAMCVAAFPASGIRPSTLVLLEPPVLPLELISREASDPSQQPAASLSAAIAQIRAAEPGWIERDVLAKAEAVMQLDFDAARHILLDNGDWDGGLADLRHPAAAGVDTWVIRGDPAAGGYVDDDAARQFAAQIGADHVITIPGAPHSPQRTHPVETTQALLRAISAQV